jgi:diguanylate cyclase (GGDEF)-like protein/PAS domain S-box-containing protein
MSDKRRWWRSIAAQLWLLVLLCSTFLGALILINTQADVRHEKDVVSSALSNRGLSTASALAPQLVPNGATVQALQGLFTHSNVVSSGPGCLDALKPLVRAIPGVYLASVDTRGTVLCSAGPENLTVGTRQFAAVPVVIDAVRSRLAGTYGPFADPATGRLSLASAVPIPGTQTTSLLYVFDTQVNLRPPDRTPGLTTALVDTRDGVVLMHYPFLQGAVGSTITGTPLAGALNDTGKVSTADGLDDTRSLFRSVAVAGTPYRLLVGESETHALAPVRKSLVRNLYLGAAAIVVICLMGLVLHWRITRPMRAVSAAIRALGEDPDAVPAPTNGPTELAEVAVAFNATAQARRRADGLSRAIVQHSSDHVLVIDPSGRITFIAPRAQQALGLHAGQHLAGAARLVHPDDRDRVTDEVRRWMSEPGGELQGEVRVVGPDQVRHFEIQGQDLRHDPDVAGVVLTCRDITERKEFEQHLAHQARHDSLTGLPNRAAVLERLQAALDDRRVQPVSVCFVDLDRFKLINDSHGHAVGDRVLAALARKLELAVRPTDLVGRFGGDEFVIVGTGIVDGHEALSLAERIQQALAEPLHVRRRELFINASIGIALGQSGDSAETILRNADTAMYRAKDRGRNCVAFFDAQMQDEAQRLLRTENELHRAVERGELTLHYQPIVAYGSTEVDSVEALVRWEHPQRGLIAPGDFIPVAEETGLVVPIGEWVLREACSWAARVGEELRRPIRVSVNVSPRQLSEPGIVDLVDEVLMTSGLPARLLCLEVTENVLVRDAGAAIVTLTALHDRGVKVAIDDFGTGWSSLTYLQQFPVDEIKLDRSYVSRVEEDPAAATIVGSLITMAHTMGLSVTAEGVETAGQDAFLREHDCDTAQGYLYAKPQDSLNAAQVLRNGILLIPAARGMMDA